MKKSGWLWIKGVFIILGVMHFLLLVLDERTDRSFYPILGAGLGSLMAVLLHNMRNSKVSSNE
ncbi:hypothetical protein HME9302_01397 [Alteripontixanthobacter maritimus]|uniref:Uncharacterized protein n=1 Tax=Alteripontixanthobacter maritimus TaxID=2161824 RepID=A0A369QAC7_9SPHN|nr:hypothetical protein HME9302_01397 [Alteripontixanthobacter maritimus]